MSKDLFIEMVNRLRRLETKIVRLADAMGIETAAEEEWLTVDDATRTIYVSTLGRSLVAVINEARRLGASHTGDHYEIVTHGKAVGSVMLLGKTELGALR